MNAKFVSGGMERKMLYIFHQGGVGGGGLFYTTVRLVSVHIFFSLFFFHLMKKMRSPYFDDLLTKK